MDILDALPLTSRRKPPVPPSYCNPNPRLTTPSLSLTRKLKRMPHLFTRTLELPFQADTVVKVAESRDSYTFAAWLPGLGARNVKVEVLEIVPGATKVVLRGLECLLPSNADDLEVDLWRFRLPPSTIPEGSVAIFQQEVLSVTIPKVSISCREEWGVVDGDNDGDSDISIQEDILSFANGLSSDETKEVRFDRDAQDDLECFGSPRNSRGVNCSSTDHKCDEFETEEQRIQREVIEDIESFGSPRRCRCAEEAAPMANQHAGSQDFFQSFGSWVGGGLAIFVQ